MQDRKFKTCAYKDEEESSKLIEKVESLSFDVEINMDGFVDFKSLRVGLPDLHPGKTPVGAVVITENVIYPHLIDNDIGCGMSMFMTDIKEGNLNLIK